jgi:uncharacterized membrane protein YkgB
MTEVDIPAARSTEVLPRSATRTLRIAFGVLFLWLGLLKIIPGMSPAEDLMRASMPSFVPIDLFIRFAALWEILVGIGFLTGWLRRLVVLMTFATMAVTLSILWMAPGRVWAEFPFRLAFDGLYVVKDLVITASAIVLAVTTVQERPELDGRFAAIVRRRWPRALDRYAAIEAKAIALVSPWSLPLLRGALGLVFIWFGALNLLEPTASPTWPMWSAVLPGEGGALAFRIWGAVGIVAGVGIATGWFDRLAVGLLLGMMLATLSYFVIAPGVMFQQPPFVLTLEGQHILKNLILAAAAIVVVRSRPSSIPARSIEADYADAARPAA